MEDNEKKDRKDRDEIFSKAVRAGKRTYFFDVKTTRTEEKYLTITESKRRFSNEQGKFFYEKHKIFLYKEDFEKFVNGLNGTLQFIETGIAPEPDPDEIHEVADGDTHFSNVDFEDLETPPAEEK
jgi:hypothetical protein